MFKIEETAQYYVGETVTSLQKTALSPGGAEAIVYATIGGGVGSLQPFVSRQDVDFFVSEYVYFCLCVYLSACEPVYLSVCR